MAFMTSIISVSISKGQNSNLFFQANAVKIEKLDSLNEVIYCKISNYKYVAVGEIHGTQEPAKFTRGLANLLSQNGDSVILGLEIPPDLMTTYLENPIDENIIKSDFFINSYDDGRASYSWIDIIADLNDNPRIRIEFF